MLNGFFHDIAVKHAVCLNPLGLDGRSLARVEDAVLQHGLVRGTSHFAAERVDFKDKLSLSRTANRRIARHIRHGVVGDGKKHGAAAHARRGKRRFTAGVSGADDGDIDGIHKVFHEFVPFLWKEASKK